MAAPRAVVSVTSGPVDGAGDDVGQKLAQPVVHHHAAVDPQPLHRGAVGGHGGQQFLRLVRHAAQRRRDEV
jgi:hypothetical protein